MPVQFERPQASVIRKSGRVRLCSIVLTQSCNLNCSYCYERFKTNKSITFMDAWSLVRAEIHQAAKNQDIDYLGIEFFGGEPLLRFDIIREIVDRTGGLQEDLKVFFYLPSNGTLLDDAMKTWFAANKHKIAIQLSYDGSVESQLKNRHKDVQSAVDFCFETWPNYPFKMTISRETLPHLAQDVKACVLRGIRLVPEMAMEEQWTEDDCKLFESQLQELASFYEEYKPKEEIMLNRTFRGTEDSTRPQSLTCGLARGIIAYDTDCIPYTCPSFMPYVSGAGKQKPFALVNPWTERFTDDPYCKGCGIRHWCTTCYAQNFHRRQAPAHRDHGRCRIMLIWAKCSLERQMLHEKQQLLEKPERETAKKLKDMLRIYGKVCRQLCSAMPAELPPSANDASPVSLSWEQARLAMQHAKEGKTEHIEAWIAQGGSLETGHYLGETMLMQATAFGHREVVEYLLDHGADINHRNALGENSLVHTARFGRTELFRLLLERGIEFPKAEDMLGRSMCMFAAIGGNAELFAECVKRGGNDSLQDGSGIPLLVYAMLGRNPMILKQVLQMSPYKEASDSEPLVTLTKDMILTLMA